MPKDKKKNKEHFGDRLLKWYQDTVKKDNERAIREYGGQTLKKQDFQKQREKSFFGRMSGKVTEDLFGGTLNPDKKRKRRK